MRSKRGLVIGSVAVCSTLTAMAVTILKARSRAKISDVRWESKVPKQLEISWFDQEVDHSKLYKIYWSNSPDIKIDRPQTYRHVSRVAASPVVASDNKMRQLVKLEVLYEWCYFVIAKKSSFTREYEAHVPQDVSFTLANLDPVVVARSESSTSVRVNVVSPADYYRVYSYGSNEEVNFEDFDIKQKNSVNLKLRRQSDGMFCIAFLIGDFESAQEFLFYDEKNSLGDHKWDTKTNLC